MDMEYGAPSPDHKKWSIEVASTAGGDATSTADMEDGSTTVDGSTIFSVVKLTTKERGYDDAFEEMKRNWEIIKLYYYILLWSMAVPPKLLSFFSSQ